MFSHEHHNTSLPTLGNAPRRISGKYLKLLTKKHIRNFPFSDEIKESLIKLQ